VTTYSVDSLKPRACAKVYSSGVDSALGPMASMLFRGNDAARNAITLAVGGGGQETSAMERGFQRR